MKYIKQYSFTYHMTMFIAKILLVERKLSIIIRKYHPIKTQLTNNVFTLQWNTGMTAVTFTRLSKYTSLGKRILHFLKVT